MCERVSFDILLAEMSQVLLFVLFCFVYCVHSPFVLLLLADLSTSASLSHFPRLSTRVSSQSDCIRRRMRSLELLI